MSAGSLSFDSTLPLHGLDVGPVDTNDDMRLEPASTIDTVIVLKKKETNILESMRGTAYASKASKIICLWGMNWQKKMGEPEDSLLSCGRMDDRNPDLLQVCPIKMQSRRSTTELYALVIWLLPMMRI